MRLPIPLHRDWLHRERSPIPLHRDWSLDWGLVPSAGRWARRPPPLRQVLAAGHRARTQGVYQRRGRASSTRRGFAPGRTAQAELGGLSEALWAAPARLQDRTRAAAGGLACSAGMRRCTLFPPLRPTFEPEKGAAAAGGN